MRTIPIDTRVVSFVAAIVVLLLLQVAPAIAGDQLDGNRPVELAFTKWVTAFPLMEGVVEGDRAFVGEVLQRQVSVNPNLNGIIRLEAIYEVQDGDRSFTALIRGGTDALTGAAILNGVVLAGWRTGAAVHVEFDTIPATTGCVDVGGPPDTTCFQGTIHVGREPKAKN